MKLFTRCVFTINGVDFENANGLKQSRGGKQTCLWGFFVFHLLMQRWRVRAARRRRGGAALNDKQE